MRGLLRGLTYQVVSLTLAAVAAAQHAPPPAGVPFTSRPRIPRQGSLIALRVTPPPKDGDSVVDVSNNPVTLDGLDGAGDITISPDGKHVYVASSLDGEIAIFQRDLRTGNLTFVGRGPNFTQGIESIVVS